MRWLRRWWYRFLRAPAVFITARPRSLKPDAWEVSSEFDWFVYCDGEWYGPYSHPEAHEVANRLEVSGQLKAAAQVVFKDNQVVFKDNVVVKGKGEP